MFIPNKTKNLMLGLTLLVFISLMVIFWGTVSKASTHLDCTGKITWVYTEIDGTQYFSLKPRGICACGNDHLNGKGFVNLSDQINHLQNYKNAIRGLISGKSVTVLYEWMENMKSGEHCKVVEIGV